MKNYLKNSIFLCMICMGSLTVCAADDNDIIEFRGDRYVIHVDKMNPDSEMTLLDVLHTCPEFLSINGKKLDLNYSLRVDNIGIVADLETFLSNVKACEIDHIHICSNSSVAKAVSGTKGVIDIYYREGIKRDGKVSLAGSTYGNGMLYADVTNRSEKLTVQAFAMAHTFYGKAYPTDEWRMTDRGLAENLHLNLDWKISESDRLIIKAFQKYGDSKTRLFNPGWMVTHANSNRYVDLVLSYSHTFKNDAILVAEMGGDYTSGSNQGERTGDSYPYVFAEFNTPIFTPDLWLMVGTELDYDNLLSFKENREQVMLADFYAQLDYSHGPWLLTFGDRYRMMHYWNRQYDSEDRSTWKHARNNHSYLASAGYKAGRNFFQALFTRRFYVPEMSDFLVDETETTTSLKYSATDYRTNLVHQGVLRYSYQQKNFFLHSSVENTWFSHLSSSNHQQLGIRSSVYWKTGPWELTFGANYYHKHQKEGADTPYKNDNFVTLKAAPTLNLPHGFRLSSVLLYSSRRAMDNQHPHLYATVKANKQFGKKCNVFAEYHDLGGYMTGTWEQLSGLYQNRAVSVGATFYPFGKNN